MSLDSLIYLLQFDWPFVAAVLVAGAVVGWRTSGEGPKGRQSGRGR
jgi:hypothetical protein